MYVHLESYKSVYSVHLQWNLYMLYIKYMYILRTSRERENELSLYISIRTSVSPSDWISSSITLHVHVVICFES